MRVWQYAPSVVIRPAVSTVPVSGWAHPARPGPARDLRDHHRADCRRVFRWQKPGSFGRASRSRASPD